MHNRSLLGTLALAAAFLSCSAPSQRSGLTAQLDGPHVKTLQLLKDEAVGGPQQPLSLQLQAGGMSGIRQFEFTVALEPPEAFDLNSISFSPSKPFITVGSGVEVTPEKNLRAIGIYLDAAGYSGDGGLGTLTVKTSSSFSSSTQGRARILRFSAGPSSSERDTYTEQQLNLSLSVGP